MILFTVTYTYRWLNMYFVHLKPYGYTQKIMVIFPLEFHATPFFWYISCWWRRNFCGIEY